MATIAGLTEAEVDQALSLAPVSEKEQLLAMINQLESIYLFWGVGMR